MKKIFAILLTSALLVSMFAVAVSAAWDNEDNWVIGEDGNYTFGDAYGFEFKIDDVNGVIDGEDATLITTAEAYAACNANWAITVALAPTENADEYSVVKVIPTPSAAENKTDITADYVGITFDNGNIAIVVHSADSKPEGSDYLGNPATFPNWQSKVAAVALKEGDLVTVNADKTLVTVIDPADIKPAAPDAISFWVTHFNDVTAEGAGAILTTLPETIGTWNLYISFAPTDIHSSVYEIVAISNGIAGDLAGKSSLTEIPEGGFVYSINRGNDYPTLNETTHVGQFPNMPNYTSAACDAMIEVASAWTLGQKFVVEGVDFAGATIPTSTPDILWHEEGYVCTAEITEYIGQALDDEEDNKNDASTDTSVDSTSNDETSKKPSTPNTGDASSMIVFAVLAVVALAGSAVVIKSRK